VRDLTRARARVCVCAGELVVAVLALMRDVMMQSVARIAPPAAAATTTPSSDATHWTRAKHATADDDSESSDSDERADDATDDEIEASNPVRALAAFVSVLVSACDCAFSVECEMQAAVLTDLSANQLRPSLVPALRS
jgi:hypothetical protein